MANLKICDICKDDMTYDTLGGTFVRTHDYRSVGHVDQYSYDICGKCIKKLVGEGRGETDID